MFVRLNHKGEEMKISKSIYLAGAALAAIAAAASVQAQQVTIGGQIVEAVSGKR